MVAHLLRSIGWDTAVFERNDEELASRGVGLGTHPQLIAILKRAGIDFDESMGITPPRGVCLDRARQDHHRAADGAHAQRLVAALPRLARCAAGGDLSVRQTADAGRTGCDPASPRFSPTALANAATSWSAPTACARRCARNSCPTSSRSMPAMSPGARCSTKPTCRPSLWREVVELYAFCLPEGEQLISYAVPGRDNDTAVGRRAYNIIWYRPTDRRDARRYLHRCQRPPSCRRHPAAADPARRDRARSKPTPSV